MLLRKLFLISAFVFSVNTYSQDNNPSLEYINYFLKSENYWGKISGSFIEASEDVFKYVEYAEFTNGQKSKWEAYVFLNHLEKIVVKEIKNGSSIFFDFHFIKNVTVYNTEYLHLRQEESEDEKKVITIRIEKKVSTNEKEYLKLAFKLLFKGVKFEEVKH